ncbi:MAG TPA: nuclear transport factor 2 family protein [Pyrinomonadaceae bacterium]|nr:nuclear transport factor 2 family protein [Pyrinomonadaceae bacterium]
MKRIPTIVCALSLAVAFGLVAASSAQQNERLGYTPALVSLVEAERAFSRTSVERGVRDAFLAFFAEDGINFQPHPTNTREAYLKRPAPAVRPPITLYWEPIFADISHAGDLGYTTGPYRLSDQSPERKPTRHGYYFSIWKRQTDGVWKVALDVGIRTPAPDEAERRLRFQAAPQRPPLKTKPSADGSLIHEREALLQADRQFISAATARGALKAFESHLDDAARLHRDGIFPLTTRETIRAYLSQKQVALWGEPTSADVAQSNDLGYTYGRYELKDAGARGKASGIETATLEKGYYVRVWKRDRKGVWKIVLDTTHPLPPAEK